MTIDEFKALQKGDRIRNAMTDSAGVVTAVSHLRSGVGGSAGTMTMVSVQWDNTTMPMAFSQVSTAWMHWTKGENGQ